MDIYADSVTAALSDSDYKLTSVTPHSRLERFSNSRMVMRYLRYWRYPRFAECYRGDIHHVLDHGYAHLHPKLNGGKTVVTVHDLIPMLHWLGEIKSPMPHATSTQAKPRKPLLNMRSLSHLEDYDRIIAVSLNTKRDLVKYLGLKPEKISVIPPVIADCFRPAASAQVELLRHKYQLGKSSKWLMISGAEFYKNHATSLMVLQELNRHSEVPFKLIKTGLRSDGFDQLTNEYGLGDSVKSIFLDDVGELVTLYSLVDCLLFPSLYEGFGMPVAEALACGTPAVVSDRGALPEVGGDLTPNCAAGDTAQLAQSIISIVSDVDRQQHIAEQGPIYIEKFRPTSVGKQLRAFYRELLNDEIA